jgi:hypothetical protein
LKGCATPIHAPFYLFIYKFQLVALLELA